MDNDRPSLPGCIGYYGKPSEGNNCSDCDVKVLCAKLSQEFIPKAELLPIYERLLKVKRILTGVIA